MNNKLVFFDICDTLYAENTTFGFLDFYFSKGVKKNLLQSRKLLPVKLFNFLSIKLFGSDIVRTLGLLLLKNLSKSHLQKKAKAYVGTLQQFKKRDGIHALLKRFRQEGYEIVLLSGSLDFIVEEIASELEISTWHATTLKWNGELCAGKIQYNLLGDKLSVINQFYTQRPYEFVTDNISDYDAVVCSTKSYILTKPKHLQKWIRLNNIHIQQIIS
jgi:HAD superfamily phosphoserine phosphatase-like hydrolase